MLGGVAPDLSPLCFNLDTEAKPGTVQMPGQAAGAGASPGSLGRWVQPWGFVAGSQAQVGQVPAPFRG